MCDFLQVQHSLLQHCNSEHSLLIVISSACFKTHIEEGIKTAHSTASVSFLLLQVSKGGRTTSCKCIVSFVIAMVVVGYFVNGLQFGRKIL